MANEITIRKLKFAILNCLAAGQRHQHKFNLIGKGYSESPLESAVGTRFDLSLRHLAVVAFNELEQAELIRPTYTDLVSPEEWVEITDMGREALKRQQLDALDEALNGISPGLVEIRAGAWSAVKSGRPDALRQAAHSGRELIDQTLKEGAPYDEIKARDWYVPAKNSTSGITRKQRLRFLMERRRSTVSDSELEVAERACALVIATDDRLKAIAHSRDSVATADVQDALVAAEIALRRVLLSDSAA